MDIYQVINNLKPLELLLLICQRHISHRDERVYLYDWNRQLWHIIDTTAAKGAFKSKIVANYSWFGPTRLIQLPNLSP